MTSAQPILMPLPPTDLPIVSKPTILLFGDSHSHAVHLAAANRVAKGRPVPLAVFRQLKEKNERNVGNITFDGFLKRIPALARKDVVLSLMGGSRHAVYSTTQHPQPFDFFTPGRGAAGADKVEIIPYRTLQTLFAEGIYERIGRRLKKMRSATEARVVHLIPPPPKGNNEYIAHHHEKLYARQGIASLGVSPPELRLKFWLLQARILKKICRNLGVEVMMPPTTAIDGGFLRPEYFAEDTTHANELYGELVLCAVEAEFS
jgi:hypothetical protein